MMKFKKLSLALVLAGVLFSCQPAEEQQDQGESSPLTSRAEGSTQEPSPEARLEAIHGDLADVIAALNEDGDYNCCVQPACTWCALHEGNCTCFSNLQEGAEVCPGCGLGWHNGEGAVDGIESGDVKWNITHEHGDGGHGH